MPQAGDVIKGFGGMELKLVSVEPDALVMEAAYPGEGTFPPLHLHPRQEERFEVLEGAMNTRIGDQECRYEPGAPFAVPPGTPHTMAADGPTRLRWEVRPALRTAEFFARLYAGELTSLDEYADEFRLASADR